MVARFTCWIVIFVLVGCRPDIGEMRSRVVVLNSVLRAGGTIQEVHVFTLSDDGSRQIALNGDVSLHAGSTEIHFARQGDRFITLTGEPVLPFQTAGVVRHTLNGRTTEARFRTPGPLIPVLQSVPEFSVNPALPLAPVYAISWTPLTGYEYVASLEELDQNPDPIPFPFESGLFTQRFSGPFLAGSIILRANDFRFFGKHRLRIIAIDQEYRDIHFHTPVNADGTLRPGVSNVENAEGYVTAVSQLEVVLDILP